MSSIHQLDRNSYNYLSDDVDSKYKSMGYRRLYDEVILNLWPDREDGKYPCTILIDKDGYVIVDNATTGYSFGTDYKKAPNHYYKINEEYKYIYCIGGDNKSQMWEYEVVKKASASHS